MCSDQPQLVIVQSVQVLHYRYLIGSSTYDNGQLVKFIRVYVHIQTVYFIFLVSMSTSLFLYYFSIILFSSCLCTHYFILLFYFPSVSVHDGSLCRVSLTFIFIFSWVFFFIWALSFDVAGLPLAVNP